MIPVAALALLDAQGRILVQQRPEGKSMAGLWEFPGGKIEAEETPQSALVREITEELDIVVSSDDLTPAGFVSEPLGTRQLLLLLFLCRKWKGTPDGKENQQIQWVDMDALEELPMPPADRPLLEQLKRYL
jgi:8-oxo-dGTP diphosphatase